MIVEPPETLTSLEQSAKVLEQPCTALCEHDNNVTTEIERVVNTILKKTLAEKAF